MALKPTSRFARPFITTLASSLLLLGCSGSEPEKSASDRLHDFFEDSYHKTLARYPIQQTWRGVKDDYDKLNNLSDEYVTQSHTLLQQELNYLHDNINYPALNTRDQLFYRLFETSTEQDLADYQWRFHDYPINQMWGRQNTIPSLLLNDHSISSISDARAYIGRLLATAGYLDQIIAKLKASQERGIIAPQFVFPKAIASSKGVISGFPFDDSGQDNVLLADFKKKISGLDLSSEERDQLAAEAEQALLTSVGPGYQKLIEQMSILNEATDAENGVWALPRGEEFYLHQLKKRTTTSLTPDQVHDIGLREVARIQGDMRKLIKQLGFDGTLKEFFTFLKNNPDMYFPQTQEGKDAYLAKARQIVRGMEKRLDTMFLTIPRAPVVVKPVEPFREKSAGRAFYDSPSLDGSKPGIFWANLSDMSVMPTYEMEAVVYHETIPGHHYQLATAQELEGVPTFVNYNSYTAYSEGWGLYSEDLAKEMGFYKDPYSDFGRLVAALIRSCRLVADTGLHKKRWTVEQTVAYLQENTPMSDAAALNAARRYLVMPAQATAYAIGKLKLLELRERAKKALGDKFDIRHFHQAVIGQGQLPMNILEEVVDDWIKWVADTTP